jgi:hypothetical protein
MPRVMARGAVGGQFCIREVDRHEGLAVIGAGARPAVTLSQCPGGLRADLQALGQGRIGELPRPLSQGTAGAGDRLAIRP